MIPAVRTVLILCSLIWLCQKRSFSDDQTTVLRESMFNDAISRPLQANGDQTHLREYLDRLGQVRNVAVLLDRRVDPLSHVPVQIDESNFENGIRVFVEPVGCNVSIIADTMVVGPTPEVSWLKTRVEICRDELDQTDGFDAKRKFELLRRRTLRWDDLATPRELVLGLADSYRIEIQNSEVIPHDLWKAGVIGNPNFIEGMLIILAQYDLSIAWTNATQVRLIPEDPQPRIIESHRPKGLSLEDALALVSRAYPDATIQREGSSFLFSGSREQHESVALLVGEKTLPRQQSNPLMNSKLRDRRFTFRMIRKPFGSLMATLQVQGIDVRYDATEIKDAGIDLGELISLELSEATIDQLLQRSCEKVGLDYEIREEVIYLKAPRQ